MATITVDFFDNSDAIKKGISDMINSKYVGKVTIKEAKRQKKKIKNDVLNVLAKYICITIGDE